MGIGVFSAYKKEGGHPGAGATVAGNSNAAAPGPSGKAGAGEYKKEDQFQKIGKLTLRLLGYVTDEVAGVKQMSASPKKAAGLSSKERAKAATAKAKAKAAAATTPQDSSFGEDEDEDELEEDEESEEEDEDDDDQD